MKIEIIEQAYEECLKQYGCSKSFPKSEVRILFKIDSQGITNDILVERFKDPKDKEYLYDEWGFDIGNCLDDWDKLTLSDVLIKLFVFYGVHRDLRIKTLLELSKVSEWRPEIAPWVYRWFN